MLEVLAIKGFHFNFFMIWNVRKMEKTIKENCSSRVETGAEVWLRSMWEIQLLITFHRAQLIESCDHNQLKLCSSHAMWGFDLINLCRSRRLELSNWPTAKWIHSEIAKSGGLWWLLKLEWSVPVYVIESYRKFPRQPGSTMILESIRLPSFHPLLSSCVTVRGHGFMKKCCSRYSRGFIEGCRLCGKRRYQNNLMFTLIFITLGSPLFAWLTQRQKTNGNSWAICVNSF